MLCVPPVHYAAPELALYVPSRWDERRVLRVRFLDGDGSIWQRIRMIEAGPEGWSSASAMQFVFGDDPDAEIRITLAPGPSWSHMGMGCLGVPKDAPTMQLGWAHRSDETELRRVWLHEAGHALGADHEHGTEQAMGVLPWDWDGFRRWHEERGIDWVEARAQWQSVTAAEVVEQASYDANSIMGYLMQGEWFTDGVQRGGANRLSEGDRYWVAQWYGPPPERPPAPTLGTPDVQAWLPWVVG